MLKYALLGQLGVSPAFGTPDLRRRQEILIQNAGNIARWVKQHPGALAGEYRRHVAPLLHMVYTVADPPCGSRPFSAGTLRQRQRSALDVVDDYRRQNHMRWEADGTPVYDSSTVTDAETSERSATPSSDDLLSRASSRPPRPPSMSGANDDGTVRDYVIDDPAHLNLNRTNSHHRGRRRRRRRANAVSSYDYDLCDRLTHDSRDIRLAAVTGLLARLFAILDGLAKDNASNRDGGGDGDAHDDENATVARRLARVAAVLESASAYKSSVSA
jgi:hypothetical protein